MRRLTADVTMFSRSAALERLFSSTAATKIRNAGISSPFILVILGAS
jgi:hypothetical protein